MPVSDLHRQVAAIALAAAAEHGFALGGGNALLAHGVISRPTQDVDLFTARSTACGRPLMRCRPRCAAPASGLSGRGRPAG
jgi:Nucleotidyl transferase AbiEii toxin, Type IV TA system